MNLEINTGTYLCQSTMSQNLQMSVGTGMLSCDAQFSQIGDNDRAFTLSQDIQVKLSELQVPFPVYNLHFACTRAPASILTEKWVPHRIKDHYMTLSDKQCLSRN